MSMAIWWNLNCAIQKLHLQQPRSRVSRKSLSEGQPQRRLRRPVPRAVFVRTLLALVEILSQEIAVLYELLRLFVLFPFMVLHGRHGGELGLAVRAHRHPSRQPPVLQSEVFFC